MTHDTAPLAAASEKYFKEVELAMTLESTLPDKHHDRAGVCVSVCVVTDQIKDAHEAAPGAGRGLWWGLRGYICGRVMDQPSAY